MLEGGLQLLGVADHRPELEHREPDAVLPGPLLREQDRPRRLEPDRERAEQPDR